jgi:predicted DCC family thiol-disulfide oxidoreductase YuxK
MVSSGTSYPPKRLTVFYDASCSVCDWEINHYKGLQEKRPDLGRIDFQDISRCASAEHTTFFIISYHVSSDNHELLASRNITQEQALDYFHGNTTTLSRYVKPSKM